MVIYLRALYVVLLTHTSMPGLHTTHRALLRSNSFWDWLDAVDAPCAVCLSHTRATHGAFTTLYGLVPSIRATSHTWQVAWPAAFTHMPLPTVALAWYLHTRLVLHAFCLHFPYIPPYTLRRTGSGTWRHVLLSPITQILLLPRCAIPDRRTRAGTFCSCAQRYYQPLATTPSDILLTLAVCGL